MRVEIKTITPELAATFLELNDGNRKINNSQLSMLSRAMTSGEWRLTHQGVAFYDDGSLADGQHRLSAVVHSGVSCEMLVCYGVTRDPSSVMAIDSGKLRSVVDSMKISGLKIKANHVTIAKGLEFGFSKKHAKLSTQEIASLCGKHKGDIDVLTRVLSTNCSGVSIAPVKVAILDCISRGYISECLAGRFYNTLTSGEYDSDIMINAVKLRNKLMSKNYNGGHERVIAYRMTANTIISTGKSIKINRVNHGNLEFEA